MKFIDEAIIEIKSGAGGNGCVSFRREKYVPKGGPDGGDGGDGGNIYFIGNRDMSTLLDFKYRQHWSAERGGHGKGKNQHGKRGKDMFIPVPLGTELIDTDTGELVADITVHGEKTLVARGGRGGRGNARFVSSTHQAPREFDTGGPVQSIRLRLSLKVIADVGIIGYPNAGKSTLISKISHARPKIADYPFTTLSPNLGVVRLPDDRTFVVADIPGIIEGASDGVGLGLRFLKHVERTKVLIHLLDLDPTNGRDPRSDYEKLNRELLSFSAPLSQKQQVVAANKVDFPGVDERLRELAQYLPIDFFPISAMVGTGVRELLEEVYRLLSLYREHDGSD